MNLKVTKRMISILCALTISTSSIVTSVGAIKAYPGIVVNAEPSANLKNAVDKLNNTLKLSTDIITTSIENIKKLSESEKNDNHVLNKLRTVISTLDDAIVIINSWNELSIQNVELADKTQKIITELNLHALLHETKDINQLASLEKNSNKIFNEIEKVNRQLADENKRLLRGDVRSKASKFKEQVIQFREWKFNNDINKKDDSTANSRKEVVTRFNEIKQNPDDNSKVKQFVELAEKVSREMIAFQNRFYSINNLQKKYDEFNEEVKAFRVWKINNDINKKDDSTANSRREVVTRFNEIKQNPDDNSKVKQFVKLAKKAAREMIAFQNRFNLNKKYDKFHEQVRAFCLWRDNNHIDKIDDITCYSRQEAIRYFNEIKQNPDDSKVEQFIKLTEQASKEMADFQNEFNSVVNDNKQDQLNKLNFRSKLVAKEKEYNQRYNEFQIWKENGHAGINYDEIKELNHHIIEQINNVDEQSRTLEYETAKQLIDTMDRAIIEIEEFKNKNNKTKEELDAELAKEINEIKNSNEPANQKIEKIVNVLENKKFNNYKRQLDVILPIIDSLYIEGEKDSHYIEGEKKVNDVLEKVNNQEINNNKQLRSKLGKFVFQCIVPYIHDQINVYRNNDVTKPLFEYIDLQKDIISDASVDVIITTTFHGKYINADQLFNIVNSNLSSYEENFKNTNHDKNMIKDIDKLDFVNLLNKIVDENHNFDSKKESEKFDIMFRKYAQRITGMETNLELEAGYGEHKLDENGEPIDIEDADLIGLQEAIDKWGIDHLEAHYIRDKVVKDNLTDVLQKYKSLNDLQSKIQDAMGSRVNKDFNLGGNAEDNEKEFKEAIDQAKQAIDDFQNRVLVIDNNEFVVIED